MSAVQPGNSIASACHQSWKGRTCTKTLTKAAPVMIMKMAGLTARVPSCVDNGIGSGDKEA
jgi:hypothetical protein